MCKQVLRNKIHGSCHAMLLLLDIFSKKFRGPEKLKKVVKKNHVTKKIV